MIAASSPCCFTRTLALTTAPERALGVVRKQNRARLSHTLLKRTVHETRPPAMTGWRGWRQKHAMERLSYIPLLRGTGN
jgi:hypothetical protein